MRKSLGMTLLGFALVFAPHAEGTHYSPPGKPTLTRCRSPEKETFTCWWEPGSDGGLPTTYALYYCKENSDTVHECPDYQTAGENSCFFNKNDTSIWVNYNITVVATNALGSSFSDPVDIDVVYIVEPNPPERLTVTVMEETSWPFLRVSWEPPHKADTRSGWITLIYEIRLKLEQETEWEMHLAGQQKMFNIFSLRSGGNYLVQVRCKPDQGFWSEWSPASKIKVPEYFHQEKSVAILVTVFTALIFLILSWLLHLNSRSLKHFILPPVPGPKIKGFDNQLLKDGKSGDVFSALVVSDFPPTASSNYEDLLVEYLEVYVPTEQEELESKKLHNGCLKCEGSTSDSDSGRGSCDSRTLLMDKCGEAKEDERLKDQQSVGTDSERQQQGWGGEAMAYAHEDMVSPDISDGRVKTWPSVFSPLQQFSLHPQQQQSSLETTKQHYLSDSLFPPASTTSCLTQPGHSTKEVLGPSYWEFSSGGKQSDLLQPHMPSCRQLQAHSDVNISRIGRKEIPSSAGLWSTEYADIQRFTQGETVLVQPEMPHGEDYSKVKGVDRDNMLLLQREGKESDEQQETNGSKEDSCTSPTVTMTKKINSATRIRDEMVVAVNGYVDTATISSQSTQQSA